MLVLSRVILGMFLGVILILVSELCFADQGTKEFIDDKLTVQKVFPLYKFTDKFALVGSYGHYEDEVVEADRVFLGLGARF